MSGIPDDAFRKILDNNIVSNHWLIQHGRAGDEGAEGRLDHHHLVDRRPARHRGDRRLCISKAADMQLARNLAHGAIAPHNIRVNCIAPGLVKTDFARALWDTPEAEKRSSVGTPLRRLGEPDDIAGAAVFLASQAGAWMTGQTIVVDGGSLTIGVKRCEALSPSRPFSSPLACADARAANLLDCKHAVCAGRT